MTRPDRMIEPSEIRTVVMRGALIEDYPEDVRGHSCLVHGQSEGGRDIHVVCAPKKDFSQSLLHIFQPRMNGIRIFAPGGYDELHPPSRTDEPVDSALSR